MTKRRMRLPPLNTMVMFEAVARLLSFTKAGEDVSLSQSAVSRQIQQLEPSLDARRRCCPIPE
ncbi:MAG: LysR family transcriptional regulator [Polaromonas sp.]